MGRSITPKYRVEYKANSGFHTPSSWKGGRATEANLTAHIEGMNQSFLPGGVNAHVSNARGVVVYVYSAKLIEQKTGRVVAEYNAPMFQVM